MGADLDPIDIRAKLERLRLADPRLQIFGSNGHRYHLHPRLEESVIRAWERDHGVELPADYRTFLLEVGNGGAGPYYGVFPLGRWDGAGDTLELFDDAIGDLGAPFPHRTAWNLPEARRTPPEEFASDEEEEAWGDALEQESFAPALTDGAFWIAEQGCALRSLLVITGPERGTIWDDLRADGRGLVPCGVTFSAWYLAWLDESLRAATA